MTSFPIVPVLNGQGLHNRPPTKDSTQAHRRRLVSPVTPAHFDALTVYRRLLGLEALTLVFALFILVLSACTAVPWARGSSSRVDFCSSFSLPFWCCSVNLPGLIQCHKLLCFSFLFFVPSISLVFFLFSYVLSLPAHICTIITSEARADWFLTCSKQLDICIFAL